MDLIILYVLIASLLVWLPVSVYLVAGRRADKWTSRAPTWLVENQQRATFVSTVVFGVLLCGDAIVRLLRTERSPRASPSSPSDFAVPQHLNPRIASPEWRLRFIDYLYLGSPTRPLSARPTSCRLRPGRKIAMAVQAVVSLCILGLVIARAVNVFT